jgi:hypothetical protein
MKVIVLFPENADTTCTRKHGLQRDMNRVYLYFQRMQTLHKLKSTGLLHAIEQAGLSLGDDTSLYNGVSLNIYNTLYIKPTLRRHQWNQVTSPSDVISTNRIYWNFKISAVIYFSCVIVVQNNVQHWIQNNGIYWKWLHLVTSHSFISDVVRSVIWKSIAMKMHSLALN